jgi:ABC-2 type transport system permease protein
VFELRAELRKLTTIRSTYVISGLCVLILGFVDFWVSGYRFSGHIDSNFLSGAILDSVPVSAVFSMVVAVLLMGHEYRYNQIIHTLTAANSRSRVLAAKIGAVFIYSFILTTVVTAMAIFMPMLGMHAGGHSLSHQQLPATLYLRVLFYCIGYSLTGLLFATLIRNLVFALVFMLIVPSTLESLVTLLLKQKAIYMPFSALSQVLGAPANSDKGPFQMGHLSPIKGAIVFSVYLAIGWAITWYLFVRRDVL